MRRTTRSALQGASGAAPIIARGASLLTSILVNGSDAAAIRNAFGMIRAADVSRILGALDTCFLGNSFLSKSLPSKPLLGKSCMD
jgi:hypothetical protein